MRNVRIVWAAAYGGLYRGSFVPGLESVARALTARGDTLDVVIPDVGPVAWHDDVRALGVTLHVVRNDGWVAARTTAALRPDVVHAHFHDWLVPVTVRLAASRARVIWHIHSTFQPDGGPLRQSPKRTIKYRLVGRRVAAFACVTRTIAAETRALGVPPRKIVFIRNAVDTARFHPPSAAERAQARARLGLRDAPAIVFFGRDPRIKGADILAEAMRDVAAATVVAVATPPAAVADLARTAQVVAVPPTDDVRAILWAADVVVIPSRGEGMPFVALEALACGVPVVASDLPWANELAADESAVVLARNGDVDSLARALRATLAAPPTATPHEGNDLDRWTEHVLAMYDAPIRPEATTR